MNFVAKALVAATAFMVVSCDEMDHMQAMRMNMIAEEYVKLSLEIGQYEPGYIDAYYGPAAWGEEHANADRDLDQLSQDAQKLFDTLKSLDSSTFDPMEKLRQTFLMKQLTAALTRIRMIKGETFTFDEETALLYDAVSPKGDMAAWDAVLAELDALIPKKSEADGDFPTRFAAFREQFIIPKDKLAEVFKASIAGCRAATAAYLDLPEGESFTFEFVTDKTWSGYNWYQGGANSLIQVNTDFPIYIERAVDLGCHEGYPGHHVFNAMLEEHLVKKRGWVEFSVYPLFSAQSLLAEGTANYGIEMAFPGEARLAFETSVLYPIAGIDPKDAATYDKALTLIAKMRYNYTDIARDYLDGTITRDEAIAARAKYGLMAMDKAEQSIRFMETYRGYVINYTLGRDLSDAYVKANSDGTAASRWAAYKTLLSSPMTASGLD